MAQAPTDSDYTSIQERIKFKESKLLNLGFSESDISLTLAILQANQYTVIKMVILMIV
ncbi:MAG: hypothetical protein JKY19_15815 [Alcanivoracaceae bacterium]|nr:hypothetical protein [Alcanivoracaceae bacterium]